MVAGLQPESWQFYPATQLLVSGNDPDLLLKNLCGRRAEPGAAAGILQALFGFLNR